VKHQEGEEKDMMGGRTGRSGGNRKKRADYAEEKRGEKNGTLVTVALERNLKETDLRRSCAYAGGRKMEGRQGEVKKGGRSTMDQQDKEGVVVYVSPFLERKK